MRVAALDPYAALSHELFLEGLRAHSRHEVVPLTLPARAWKWRMRTAALHYAPLLAVEGPFDLLLASDYVNLAELVALLPPRLAALPRVAYFHENQLTYPLREGEARDHHFALTHAYAVLTADRVLFNSRFHLASFARALEELLGHVPDVDARPALEALRTRAGVLPLGTDLPAGAPRTPSAGRAPTLLWSHRWEHDKAPEVLLEALERLVARRVPFRVRLLGQRFRREPSALGELSRLLGERLEPGGFAAGRADYRAALARAHVFVSTARHEFFGLATLEALRAGCLPVLPDGLAYPELLPPGLRGRRPFLYRGGPEAAAEALEEGLRLAAAGGELPARRRIVARTERFAWPRLGPVYDRVLAAAAGRKARGGPPGAVFRK